MSWQGIIYAYPNYVGQVQSISGLKRRHSQHKIARPDWPTPEVLEIVTGISKSDLIFNLTWAETVWIFARHTYRPIWSSGLNKLVPFSTDYQTIGKLGAQRIQELGIGIHAEGVSAKGGRIGGRIHAESGHCNRIRPLGWQKNKENGNHLKFALAGAQALWRDPATRPRIQAQMKLLWQDSVFREIMHWNNTPWHVKKENSCL